MADKALTVAIAGALAAPMAAQAVDFKISGHVNRALFVVDKDGDGGTKAQVTDNSGSSTRVRVTGSSEMEDGNRVGIQWEYQASGSGVSLRHANVQYSGGFGKMTIGQGSEAGDGSAYSDTTGVFGIGHGAGTSSDFSLGDYFGSLDAGGRINMVRYDSPSLGPITVAMSVGNDDSVSGRLKLSTDMGGTSVGAQLATLQMPGDTSTLGASFGTTMAGGLTLSGAWAKGKDMAGAEGMPPVDPSYLQAEIGYKFGDSGVAVSWYQSEDFQVKGSEGTAIGIGARHTLPKVGADFYTAVQNYSAKKTEGAASEKETVFVVGTRVKF